ncbi:FIMAH domain-containing protein [Virgibacillus ihumii]|uniref:FIMAH domain-containing protein n=1 Tax=Virgibacillus ihumii TaxID=2686091 RepID=UPI00157CB15A
MDYNLNEMDVLIADFEQDGEFANFGAARSLQAKLSSVTHFIKRGKTDKAVKHMDDFLQKLEQKREKEFISEYAYGILKQNAEYLVRKWR